MGKVYQNAIGVDILVAVGKSVAAATLMQIHVKKPDGTEVVWTATAYNDTTLVYKTIAGDLNLSGVYTAHAYVEWGATSKHLGNAATFQIYKKYVQT